MPKPVKRTRKTASPRRAPRRKSVPASVESVVLPNAAPETPVAPSSSVGAETSFSTLFQNAFQACMRMWPRFSRFKISL